MIEKGDVYICDDCGAIAYVALADISTGQIISGRDFYSARDAQRAQDCDKIGCACGGSCDEILDPRAWSSINDLL